MALKEAMLLLYLFVHDLPIYQVERMLPDMAQTTIIRFYSKVRDIYCSPVNKEMFDEAEASQHSPDFFLTLILTEVIYTC